MPALAAARALWRACVHLPAPDHLRVRFTPNQHLLAESCDLVGVLDFEHDLARAGAPTNADKNVRARSEPKKKGEPAQLGDREGKKKRLRSTSSSR